MLDDDRLPATHVHAGDPALQSDLRKALTAAIDASADHLPRGHCARDVEGLSTRDIADTLGSRSPA